LPAYPALIPSIFGVSYAVQHAASPAWQQRLPGPGPCVSHARQTRRHVAPQVRAEAVADEERALAALRQELAARERELHGQAAEQAAAVAAAQVGRSTGWR